MDDESKIVTVDGEVVSLTPSEYNILKLLMENPGRVFPPRKSMNASGMRMPAAAAWLLYISAICVKKLRLTPRTPLSQGSLGSGVQNREGGETMTKLSYTLGMKVFACFIAVLSGITAFFDGIGIFLANSYGFYSSEVTPANIGEAFPFYDDKMLLQLYGMRDSLLPILVISLLLFAISVIYLLCAAGHRPDTDEIVPNLQDKIPLDLYFAIVCPISLAILFLILEGRNPLPIRGHFPCSNWLNHSRHSGTGDASTCVTRLKLGRYFISTRLPIRSFASAGRCLRRSARRLRMLQNPFPLRGRLQWHGL